MCVSSGDIVLTTYGVAVVVKTYRSEDGKVETFKARIWRIPSKSIASSSVAYLQSNCVSLQNISVVLSPIIITLS